MSRIKDGGFRPFIGVSFCKHYARTTLCCSKVFVFVPLSGSVSVNDNGLFYYDNEQNLFSSPYRGQFL